MKVRKSVMALAMALALSVSSVPAFAAEVDVAGNSGDTPVLLTADATTFNVTVPTSIAIHVNADGTVTCPSADAVKIVNNSAGAVKVTQVDMKDSAWSLVDYNDGDRSDVAAAGVDARKLGMELTAAETALATSQDGDQTIGTDPANWKMTGVVTTGTTNELPITTAAIASALSAAIADDAAETAANVVFTLAWDAVEPAVAP